MSDPLARVQITFRSFSDSHVAKEIPTQRFGGIEMINEHRKSIR